MPAERVNCQLPKLTFSVKLFLFCKSKFTQKFSLTINNEIFIYLNSASRLTFDIFLLNADWLLMQPFSLLIRQAINDEYLNISTNQRRVFEYFNQSACRVLILLFLTTSILDAFIYFPVCYPLCKHENYFYIAVAVILLFSVCNLLSNNLKSLSFKRNTTVSSCYRNVTQKKLKYKCDQSIVYTCLWFRTFLLSLARRFNVASHRV